MNVNSLLAGFVFSTIGIGAWIYGKKSALWKPMAIGVVLMVYPYFVWDLIPIVAVGCLLTASLFVFRD